MLETIKKRDGRVVPFLQGKITEAVYKACHAAGNNDGSIPLYVTEEVMKELNDCKVEQPTVEEVQDVVEKVLIRLGYEDVAKAYIIFRYRRNQAREMKSSLMQVFKDLTFKDAADSDLKRENANINADTAMGTMLKYGSEGAKNFYNLFVIDPRFVEAHKDGAIHIHDMDFYTLTETCCQIDLTKLFENGFSTGHGFLREPNSIQTAAALACIAIQANQNDQHGGQGIPKLDYDLAPYVAKSYIKELKKVLTVYDVENVDSLDKELMDLYHKEGSLFTLNSRKAIWNTIYNLINHGTRHYVEITTVLNKALLFTQKDTYQAMEALIHNLNTMHSRAGAQIPFSSVNYGTCTTTEGRMVIDNLLEATWNGLGNGETPIFPIQIFKVKDGVSGKEGDPNYDLFKKACKVSAKRLFPNFSFMDAPFNKQYIVDGNPSTECAYMGCRTRVIGNRDKTKEIVTGRGNLSFTSINLPRIALESSGWGRDTFYEILDSRIDLVIEQLLERFKIQCSKKVFNYPFLMEQGIWIDSDKLDSVDSVADVLRHGSLACGFIGLAECLKVMTGSHHGESQEAQELGLEIISHMRAKLDEACEKYDLNFSLIATPAEGLSGRFVSIDKKKFGEISGVTDREYYTNSFHVPVYYPITAYKKLSIEAPYHALTNGGHISYVEMDGDPLKNLEAFEDIVMAMKKLGIGYGSINHAVDRCPVCGYTGIIDDECPQCGRHDGEAVSAEKLKSLGFNVKEINDHEDYKC